MSYFSKHLKTTMTLLKKKLNNNPNKDNNVNNLDNNNDIVKRDFYNIPNNDINNNKNLSIGSNKGKSIQNDNDIYDLNVTDVNIPSSPKLSTSSIRSFDQLNKIIENDHTDYIPIIRKSISNIGDDNVLLRLYLEKMASLNGESRILGRVFGYLHDPTKLQGLDLDIRRDIRWRFEVISDSFLTGIPYIMNELSELKLDISSTDITEGVSNLLTYKTVLEAHFDLLDTWFADRIHDLSGMHFTKDKWSFKWRFKIKELLDNLEMYQKMVSTDKVEIFEELNKRGILNDKYKDSKVIQSIFKKLTDTGSFDYFPTRLSEDPESYFKTTKDIMNSSTSIFDLDSESESSTGIKDNNNRPVANALKRVSTTFQDLNTSNPKD